MYNLENYLVQYATFNWQHSYIDLKLNRNAINVLIILFVLIFLTKWIFSSKKHKKKVYSKPTQTDVNCFPEISDSKAGNYSESYQFLLESFLNHKYFRKHFFNCWTVNFNEFQFSKANVSQATRVAEMREEGCGRFQISQMRTIENEELVTFTFRLRCSRLAITVRSIVVDYHHNVEQESCSVVTDLDLSALVMIRFSENVIVLKSFPDGVHDLLCEFDSTAEQRSMSVEGALADLSRNLKRALLETLEMEWTVPMSTARSTRAGDVPYDNTNDHLQPGDISHISDLSNQEILASDSQILENVEAVDENAPSDEPNELFTMSDNSTIEKSKQVKELMSHASLFTTDSYDFYDQGEESPFHDRVSSKLVGRTLVVGLVKVVEAQELKTPLKNGYCILELDEPYQRHVSHLISLVEYPIWNQHFVFSLNSNSQRLSVELFHATKKCQNPISLGVSVIPISLIIVDPSGNYFPINNNQIGSRKSWRCDVIAGGVDSKIPAFFIEFQIMKSIHDLSKTTADPTSDLSSTNSGLSLPLENVGKFSDFNDPDTDNGHKMQTIPEAQTPENTLTKNRSDASAKAFLREKAPNESGRPNSVMRKIRHRFSRLSVPWLSEKSKSDDCLDQMSDGPGTPMAHGSGIPVQPPAELFMTTSKPKFFSKVSDVDLRNSRSLSISLKKVFNIPSRKIGNNDQYKEKSLEQLFKQMDPKLFDTISNEGFNRIMNNK